MAGRFGMRIKTRMSAEELEDQLAISCQSPFTLSFDGMDKKDGVDTKIVIVHFATDCDRKAFRARIRGNSKLHSIARNPLF